MLDFSYYNPARIIFGKNALDQLKDMLEQHAGKRILLHYGGGSIKKNGLYEQVVSILREAGVEFAELGGVQPNPRVSLVRKGVALCREEQLDFVLAVGGGSVIDSAKAIAAGALYEGDIWECFESGARIARCLPLGVVLTIPAAGSETSSGMVITNDETHNKRPTGGECLIPRFAILNPEVTYSLPAYQTACGASDILSHMLERYFTNEKQVDYTDRLLEGALRSVLYNAPRALRRPDDYDARAQLMWAGTIAHNNLLGTGRLGDWGSHSIGHELSALYDLAHGASLSIIHPAWMKYVHHANPDKFVQFAQRVFDVDIASGQDEEIIAEMIRRLEQFYRSLGLPVRLADAGIDGGRLREMAGRATAGGPIGQLKKLDAADVYAIYQLALAGLPPQGGEVEA